MPTTSLPTYPLFAGLDIEQPERRAFGVLLCLAIESNLNPAIHSGDPPRISGVASMNFKEFYAPYGASYKRQE